LSQHFKLSLGAYFESTSLLAQVSHMSCKFSWYSFKYWVLYTATRQREDCQGCNKHQYSKTFNLFGTKWCNLHNTPTSLYLHACTARPSNFSNLFITNTSIAWPSIRLVQTHLIYMIHQLHYTCMFVLHGHQTSPINTSITWPLICLVQSDLIYIMIPSDSII